jgi:hypothetical protein
VSLSVTSNVNAALSSRHLVMAMLLDLVLDSGTVRLTDAGVMLPVAGNNYEAAGKLISIDDVQDAETLEATQLTFVISGIPNAYLSLALQEHVQGRSMSISLALVDQTTWSVVEAPSVAFAGRINAMSIVRGATTCTINVTAESPLIDLYRPVNRRANDADHRSEHPTDGFFQATAKLSETEIVWPSREAQIAAQ